MRKDVLWGSENTWSRNSIRHLIKDSTAKTEGAFHLYLSGLGALFFIVLSGDKNTGATKRLSTVPIFPWAGARPGPSSTGWLPNPLKKPGAQARPGVRGCSPPQQEGRAHLPGAPCNSSSKAGVAAGRPWRSAALPLQSSRLLRHSPERFGKEHTQ